MEYDVFISCKSEDYIYAEEIYNFLRDNGFNVFLANKELRGLSDSEYRRAISQALKSTYHLIVFASKPEYVDSTWVYYEWDWFLVAKLKGKKSGQLLSILKDVSIDDVNADLWKYESKTFLDYKDSLLSYVETPEHHRREEEKKRELKEAARIKKERLSQLVKEKEAEYERYSSILGILEKEIIDIYKQIGKAKKICPICENLISIDDAYCNRCGWTFHPIFQSDIKIPEQQSLIIRSIWNTVSSYTQNKDSYTSQDYDQKEIIELRKRVNILERDNAIYIERELSQRNAESVNVKTSKKLMVNDIWNVIKPYFDYTGYVFADDKLSQIGFHAWDCMQHLKYDYGINIITTEIDECKTYGDLKTLIKKKILD